MCLIVSRIQIQKEKKYQGFEKNLQENKLWVLISKKKLAVAVMKMHAVTALVQVVNAQSLSEETVKKKNLNSRSLLVTCPTLLGYCSC